jgi:phosphomannomutase
MTKIKFGTDGWRAIIAQEYTVENVARVTKGTADWLKDNFEKPHVVIGHDCRFAGELFAETATKVLLNEGVKVDISKGFVSTPMVSLGTVNQKASLGIVITASHNPPAYNGFKLKGHFGGPLSPEHVQEIEDIIPEFEDGYKNIDLEDYIKTGQLTYIDLETMYCDHMTNSFDIEAIQNSGLRLAYDAMYGAGQNVLKRVLPQTTFLHCEENPSFMGQAPEPIHKNLLEFSDKIANEWEIDCGLATDGDADRIGLYNSKGEFIDSHHLILLLVHYLHKYKGYTGKVVVAFSVTPKVEQLCKVYGIEIETVKIGFKYVAGIMVNEDVLLGGEESGGIATKGHIPERDGIWMGMIIWEYMATSGKSLDDLIDEVYDVVGPFKFERSDLHINEDLKQSIIADCKSNKFESFGEYEVERVETIDGFKFFFDDDRWLMIRPSGTEPVLRTYAEAPTMEEVRKILKVCEETIVK